MARHADPVEEAFLPSVLRAAGKALGVLLAVTAVTAIAVVATDGSPDGSSDGSPDGSPAMVDRGETTPTAGPSPSPSPAPVEETTEPSRPGTPIPTPTAAMARPTETAVPGPGSTTVQVLDGGAGAASTEEVAALLTDAGYDVVAVRSARCCYEVTTALWSAGAEAAAHTLMEAEPRIVDIDENPNLSQEVDVHVVVGTDWSS